MIRFRVWLRSIALLAMISFGFICTAFAADLKDGVDWERSVVIAEGYGFAPQNTTNPMQAKILAKRAAMSDALRRLGELVGGVQVTAETTVDKMMIESDIVRTRVQTTIKGAKLVEENLVAPGSYRVVMELPMFGSSDALAASVMTRHNEKKPFPSVTPNVAPAAPQTKLNIEVSVNGVPQNTMTAKVNSRVMGAVYADDYYTPVTDYSPYVFDTTQNEPTAADEIAPYLDTTENTAENMTTDYQSEAVGGFTSLVVDCRELGLKPVMSAVIRTDEGNAIYGAENLDFDLIIEKGMVAYTADSTLANVSRAGENPLFVRALELQNFSSNPIISVADANRILIENQSSGFLDKLNVVFLR